ncbi:hypothetical protein CFE70_001793 [Pyrenophora teres f. teres 0-1]|uniref:Aminoglycoside phosphotransferase domain-containing protein n=2 Tax=Pyrenophora teres f. teres TaxID=97479 RepID=E3RQ99_PYRTT|nr:hypothetical protein PTT_10876 [Pyrenophora teres f. teres 0-1]KAE8842347.1 hypothetical protein HRS9139_01644 [Pyrenophora teres f. teres]KAE8850582.1 hypothetical protein PTNB85_00998 [Pyrenophora teres f. teres]KAE8851385.1 hypothetical protein HRS9122_01672 [Pyrenophora teres f. teres]KAE8870056.1 hypothetical protein PTNB29_00400 [Pyrenophora teres f. teres]
MTSSRDLTNEHGLREYLETKQSGIGNIQFLSGGTANYVYRVTKHDGSKSIFKHAAPYLYMNKSFALDPTRMNYEAHVLEKFSSSASPFPASLEGSNVHAVRLLRYDKESKLLEIEDGGSRNLKDAYTDKTLDIPHIGKELAIWLAALHTYSQDMSLQLPDQAPGINNNPIAVDIYRYSYRNLHTALSQFDHDPQLAHRIDDEFGSLLATEDECVCHGDFWPGNVLVHITEDKPAEMTIVDWEIVRRGTSATDVGQFAAEAFLVDRFRGGRGLLAAFLHSYITAWAHSGVLGKTWLRRMVVHWAVHVAFWPTRVEWADWEGTKQLVDIGVTVLQDVVSDDWEKVLKSPLLEEVRDVYAALLAEP